LIEKDVKVDKAKNTGETPLIIVAYNGHLKVIKILKTILDSAAS
jgi:ankyrin repeat protein